MIPSLPSAFATKIVESWRPGGRFHAFVGQSAGELPHAVVLGELLDLAFFASLVTEEGHQARFSLAIAAPDPLIAHRIDAGRVTPESLGKLSAACDWNATLLFVWRIDGEWRIWGIGSNAAHASDFLVLTVRQPGSLLLRFHHVRLFATAHGRGDLPSEVSLPPQEVVALLSESLPAGVALDTDHLASIYRVMRAHGRGGALLVVPDRAPQEIHFAYPTVTASVPSPLAHAEATEAEGALIGRLTAMDGIAVINHHLELLGFGGKIPVPDDFGSTPLLHIDPRNGERTLTTARKAFTGMRHNSAAMACARTAGAFALVQSQDGHLSIILHRAGGELWLINPLERLTMFEL